MRYTRSALLATGMLAGLTIGYVGGVQHTAREYTDRITAREDDVERQFTQDVATISAQQQEILDLLGDKVANAKLLRSCQDLSMLLAEGAIVQEVSHYRTERSASMLLAAMFLERATAEDRFNKTLKEELANAVPTKLAFRGTCAPEETIVITKGGQQYLFRVPPPTRPERPYDNPVPNVAGIMPLDR